MFYIMNVDTDEVITVYADKAGAKREVERLRRDYYEDNPGHVRMAEVIFREDD